MSYGLGIDLGGSVIKAGAADPRGTVLSRRTEWTRDGAARAGDWVRCVRRMLDEIAAELEGEARHIGVAAPGLADREGTCIAHLPGKLQGLEGLVWKDALDTSVPVTVLNDAHAALLGEAWTGAARGCRDVVLLTLGTGVGGAVIANGRLLVGASGRAGHLGHLCLNPDDPRTSIAGMPGALELFIGDYTVGERSGGRFVSTEELVRAYEGDDSAAPEIWSASLPALRCAIASCLNLFAPDRIMLAGGIAKAGGSLLRPLESVLDAVVWRHGGPRAP